MHGRHGVRQLRSGWADGPSYITQCPIRPGQSYAYDFRIVGQRGTLWWHAHFSWLRATLYGPLVILPPRGVPYPFPKPDRQVTLMLGKPNDLQIKRRPASQLDRNSELISLNTYPLHLQVSGSTRTRRP